MKKDALAQIPVSDLVKRFAEIVVAQDVASLAGEISKYNRLYVKMMDVSNELKARDGDQRRALSELFNHQNFHVRLQAAKVTLAVLPLEARVQLQAIVDSGWFPQAGDAGMSLWNLDQGVYKPT